MARVALLVAEGFSEPEVRAVFDRLPAANHRIFVIGPQVGATLRADTGRYAITVEDSPDAVDPSTIDAVVVPGGGSPDHLRTDAGTVQFLREAYGLGRWIAAIGHGPSLLIEAEAVAGHRLTSAPAIRTDLRNAGARWEDRALVEDGPLITARGSIAVDAWMDALLRRLRPDRSTRAGTMPPPA